MQLFIVLGLIATLASVSGDCGVQEVKIFEFILIMKAKEMHYFSSLFDKVLYIISDMSTVRHQEYHDAVYTQ
jgi:Zn-dependent peptidase ImmA (M78 family)